MKRNPKPSETAIKICGITRAEDASVAREVGADFVGVIVEVSVSPRSVKRSEAVRLLAGGDGVALTYDAPVELCEFLASHAGPVALQLAGTESVDSVRDLIRRVDCEVWKSLHLAPAGEAEVDVAAAAAQVEKYAAAGVAAVVLDTAIGDSGGLRRGGTGRRHDWEAAARIVASSATSVADAEARAGSERVYRPRLSAETVSCLRPLMVRRARSREATSGSSAGGVSMPASPPGCSCIRSGEAEPSLGIPAEESSWPGGCVSSPAVNACSSSC